MDDQQDPYQIEMCTDGKHKVLMTFEDPADSNAAIAAARGIYSQLVRDEGLVEPSKQAKPLDRDEPPICGVHQVPMVLVDGRRGPFWSCHEKNDGSWCRYTVQLN